MEAIGPAYVTAATIGALHGVEPGHGWPVAAVYALGRTRVWAAGLAAGALIGGAHLVSSFAVVIAFQLLDGWIGLTAASWIGRVAGLALIAMGVVQWRRGVPHDHAGPRGDDHGHAHTHGRRESTEIVGNGLWGIALFAFALGFAHEEEVAILGLCAGRASCWGVMATYAGAVAGTILSLTLLSVASFDRLRRHVGVWRQRLQRISAVVLVAMGILYVVGVL